MLSNNMKLLCITILCALIGAVVIIAFKTDSGGEPAFSRPVYTVSDGEIDNIEVENESGSYCIERNEEKKVRADGKEIIDIVYGVKNRAGVTLSQDKVKELLNDFYEFHVIKTFSNIEEKDLNEYGFTGTDAYVTINKKDGSSDTFILGGVTPDEKERYVWKKGEDKVYSMLKVKESSFLNELNYYRERRIGTLDAYTLLSFSVTDKGERIMGIRYKNQNDREVVTTDAITYVMILPYKEAVNIERFGELMSAFDEVRAVDFTEDNPRNLSKYGLDDAHALRVVIQDVEQNRHELTFGFPDEKGNVYTMYQDYDFVFTTEPKMYNAVKDLNPAEFIDKYTNIYNMEDVKRVIVNGTSKTYQLDIESYGEKKFKINGKEALDRGFRSVYQGIIGIKITGQAEEELKEKEVLDITFAFKDGSVKTTRFYEYDEFNFGALCPDGTYGLVSERFINNLLEILEAFDKKPQIEP